MAFSHPEMRMSRNAAMNGMQPDAAAGRDGHLGAGGGQRDRDDPADPAGCARHDLLLPGQVKRGHDSSHCVGSVIVGGTSAAGFTRRTISLSAIRTYGS